MGNASAKDLNGERKDEFSLDSSTKLNDRAVSKPSLKINLTDFRGKSANFVPSAGVGYVGEADNLGRKHGIGRFIYDNGDDYEGEWKDDRKHGRGIYKLSNGDIYEGEFVDGFRCGKGVYKYYTGAMYSGEFQNNKMHGSGTYIYNSGVKYIGNFTCDKMNGEGTLHFMNGTSFQGLWANGEAVKKSGKMVSTSSSCTEMLSEMDDPPLSRSRSEFMSPTNHSSYNSSDSKNIQSKSLHVLKEPSKSEKGKISPQQQQRMDSKPNAFDTASDSKGSKISPSTNINAYNNTYNNTHNNNAFNNMQNNTHNTMKQPFQMALKVEDMDDTEDIDSDRKYEMFDIYRENSRKNSTTYFEMDRSRLCDKV